MYYERKYLLNSNFSTKRDYNQYTNKNRHQLKKFIVIFGFICFFLYVFIDFNLKSKITRLKDHFTEITTRKTDLLGNVTKAYFVDTIGCKMPSFNIIDDVIHQYMYSIPKFYCNKPVIIIDAKRKQFIFNMNSTELYDYYNITDIQKVECYSQEFKRKTDLKNDYVKFRTKLDLSANSSFTIENSEFFQVICRYENWKPFYKDYFFIAINKTDQNKNRQQTIQEKRSRYYLKTKPISNEVKTININNSKQEKLSVMIIGIDSVSRLNFFRQMNRTATLLREKFESFEFHGYNKVGDNTYPNLVPTLTGLDENELNISCLARNKNTTYDKCPFIWRRFKDQGYKTVFAEDIANLGLFNYFRAGFKVQPTDYYLRPIFMEMEKSIAYKKRANMRLCLGGRRPVDVILESIKQLIPLFQKNNFFSFFWMASLTHDFFNMPKLMDDDIADLFEELNTAGVLNKTIVFFMSDHGLRWGSFRKTYQGMMEERQPLLQIILPHWFKTIFPKASENLQRNAHKLTTHYDLHATLIDLLNPSTLETNRLNIRSIGLEDTDIMPKGISLFLPIPVTRTCELAGISSHWCTCHEKRNMQTNDAQVQRAARYIVKKINEKLHSYPQCRVLFLNSILEATIGASNKKILKEITTDFLTDITVRIQTKPGLGEFESTVRMSFDTLELTGTISRINMYGSQSYCIDDYLLKMYCYCHR